MSQVKQAMSIPMAIIVAGVLIAGAIYFSKVGPAQVVNNQAVAPTPGPLPEHFDIRAVSDADHIRGDKNASVTIMEFSDLECPFCKVAHQVTNEVLAKNEGKVRLVFRHAFIHKQSEAEANAGECASAQGKFWEFIDVIFANTTSNDGLALDKLPEYATSAGVQDVATFTACVQNKSFLAKVQADNKEFGELSALMSKAGRPIGTPFFIVIGPTGKEIPIIGAQPLEAFQTAIDAVS